MKITLSVATSGDYYMDDMSPRRLVLSSEADWAEVYRLRAESDAILIGGETLRRDNPTLGLKGAAANSGATEPMRVVVSGRGEISTESKMFHKGGGKIVIFSNIERPELVAMERVERVIVAPKIDVALIVTELEKLGVEQLFVEGGAKILSMFLDSKLSSQLRLAINPNILVADDSAPRFELPRWVEECERNFEHHDYMAVTTYTLDCNSGSISDTDRAHMRGAIEYSVQSPPKDSCYRVGALIETSSGEIFKGYTLETSPTHHAEQAAMKRALDAGADLRGATIYASMEPCSQRSSEPESCSELIIRHGFSRVLFALYEPSHFVECHGAENLRQAGVEVICMREFAQDVLEINAHVLG